jgi:hypothetical protein
MCNWSFANKATVKSLKLWAFLFGHELPNFVEIIFFKHALFFWHPKSCLEGLCLECGVIIFLIMPRKYYL